MQKNKTEKFDHGLPANKYNTHSWIAGNPSIGDGVWIGAFTLIDAIYSSLRIGKGCNIASGAQIITHSTVRRCLSENKHKKIESAPVTIGNFCFIGSNAIVLMGSKIGHHSVIAAGAVVSEYSVIPPYSIVAGVPARIIGNSKRLLTKKI